MRRDIGCCTWIFEGDSLSVIAERVARTGLDGVELLGDIERVNPAEAGRIFAAKGLRIFSVTPGDADISHPDEAIRAAAVDYYRRLINWSAELGQGAGAPRISCHGFVTRIRPVTTQVEENSLLVESARRICGLAAAKGLTVVFEILNRYESHQIRTVAEGLDLLTKVNAPNLALLPDAYHMNIEEADPATALRRGGAAVGLYHAADSNRGAIGDGHTDFAAQIAALDAIGYAGPIILETAAPGPDPFSTNKGEGFLDVLEAQLKASAIALRALGS